MTVDSLEERIAALEAAVRLLTEASESSGDVLEMLHAAHRVAEMRAFLAAQPARVPPAAGGQAGFLIEVICTTDIDLARITRPDLILDDTGLRRLYAQSLPGIGAIPANDTGLAIEGLTARLSLRLAKRFAARLKLPVELLNEAWAHTIWMELWQLLAARHLARRLAATTSGQPVVIPLRTTRFAYLSHGAENENRGVSLFYLAAELQRRGVAVAFALIDPDLAASAQAQGTLALRFEPYRDLWLPNALPETAPAPGEQPRGALVGAGIRGIGHVLARYPDLLKIQSSYVFDPAFGSPEENVVDLHHLPVALTLPLSGAGDREAAGSSQVLSIALPNSNLGEYLNAALGGATVAASRRADELVVRHRLTEVHICDHPFFESAILAHAVRARGGKVSLWPHGCNPVLPWLRRPGTVETVYSPLASMGEVWKARLPGTRVEVVPYLWLPKYSAPRPYDPAEPLSVVIVSAEISSVGLDVMNRPGIESIYRRLFKHLGEMAPEVHFTCRPRSQGNLNWLWRLAGHAPDFSYSQLIPTLIDLPNMVFLFVGQLSSAVYEGIGRGIPVLYVREDQAVEEYAVTALPECLPAGDVDFILGEVRKCLDPVYRQALTERQVAWYDADMGSAV